MYSLSSPIIDEILFDNKKFKLNLAFDNVLRVYELWKDELFSNEEKLNLSLQILIRNGRTVQKLSVSAKNNLLKVIFDNFISSKQKQSGGNEKAFDFIQDADFIFASFLMDYGIDLIEQQGKLHWWKFISLFKGLSSRTKIREVMSIRAKRIPEPNKYNADEIKALMELKSYYALEFSQEEQEQQFERQLDKLANALEKRAVGN